MLDIVRLFSLRNNSKADVKVENNCYPISQSWGVLVVIPGAHRNAYGVGKD